MKVRKRAFGTALAVLAVGLLASGCDWYQFGGLSGLAGDNPGETVITPANVSSLTQKYVASTNAPEPLAPEAVVNGVLYATTLNGVVPTLYAFDAHGTNGCSSTPTTCAPLWTAPHAGGIAVSNGFVYAQGDVGLEAFDAAGQTNCGGSPKICQPLWQAPGNFGAPTVANGSVFTVSGFTLEAFDASGTIGCGGSPRVCTPMWTAPGNGLVAVSAGRAYVEVPGSATKVAVLDANGVTNCSGAPKVCAPLWTYQSTYIVNNYSVAGSTLYIDTWLGNPRTGFDTRLEAYDAGGTMGRSGTPKVCTSLWQAPGGGVNSEPPVVGDGTVVVPPQVGPSHAYDANGSSNCSGSPVVCNPLWSTASANELLAIAGSVLYTTTPGGAVSAYDVSGHAGCSGASCTPLWSAVAGSTFYGSIPVIANGTLFVGTQDSSGNGEVVAYGLP